LCCLFVFLRFHGMSNCFILKHYTLLIVLSDTPAPLVSLHQPTFLSWIFYNPHILSYFTCSRVLTFINTFVFSNTFSLLFVTYNLFLHIHVIQTARSSTCKQPHIAVLNKNSIEMAALWHVAPCQSSTSLPKCERRLVPPPSVR
jgi:hypothetical protein